MHFYLYREAHLAFETFRICTDLDDIKFLKCVSYVTRVVKFLHVLFLLRYFQFKNFEFKKVWATTNKKEAPLSNSPRISVTSLPTAPVMSFSYDDKFSSICNSVGKPCGAHVDDVTNLH